MSALVPLQWSTSIHKALHLSKHCAYCPHGLGFSSAVRAFSKRRNRSACALSPTRIRSGAHFDSNICVRHIRGGAHCSTIVLFSGNSGSEINNPLRCTLPIDDPRDPDEGRVVEADSIGRPALLPHHQ